MCAYVWLVVIYFVDFIVCMCCARCRASDTYNGRLCLFRRAALQRTTFADKRFCVWRRAATPSSPSCCACRKTFPTSSSWLTRRRNSSSGACAVSMCRCVAVSLCRAGRELGLTDAAPFVAVDAATSCSTSRTFASRRRARKSLRTAKRCWVRALFFSHICHRGEALCAESLTPHAVSLARSLARAKHRL